MSLRIKDSMAGSVSGSVTGNAGTATKLQTARTINGTNFDGSAAITTANWGTARTLTIGNTGKSVNGSANVSWSLSEIGAAAASHTHSYVPTSTGGNITIHADSDASTTTEYALIKAGHNELKITSSGGGTTSTKGQDKLTFNGNVVYHAGKKPTAADIGAAASSHTHNYAGSASAGGAANSATVLATARTINGTSFNGSANITTANWGTARTLTIGSTGKSVNGSANVSWSLSEIGAAAASHTHNYLPLSGGTVTGKVASSVSSGTHLAANQGTAIIHSTAAGSGYNMLARMKSTNGVWTFGSYGSNFNFYYTSDTTINAGTNSTTKTLTLLNEAGNSIFPGSVTAPAFSGTFSGNATTATTLQNARTINGTSFNGSANITTANWGTARTLTIGNTGKSVNGSGNVSWSLSEIGALSSGSISTLKTAKKTIVDAINELYDSIPRQVKIPFFSELTNDSFTANTNFASTVVPTFSATVSTSAESVNFSVSSRKGTASIFGAQTTKTLDAGNYLLTIDSVTASETNGYVGIKVSGGTEAFFKKSSEITFSLSTSASVIFSFYALHPNEGGTTVWTSSASATYTGVKLYKC